MRVGIASDHGGFVLKEQIAELMRGAGHEVVDFGAHQLSPGDDYPDYVIPLANAVATGKVDRGVALCGSGVGASICANKVAGVRAGLIHDIFSAHQGVEDDDMNVFSLGGKVIGSALAWELIETFLKARFSGAERHQRRVDKVNPAFLGRPICRGCQGISARHRTAHRGRTESRCRLRGVAVRQSLGCGSCGQSTGGIA